MSNRRARPPQFESIGTYATVGLVALAGMLVLYLLATGIFKVNEYEQAVLLRFGRFHRVVEPGLHLKLPWIDEAIVVDASERSLRLPWGTSDLEQAGRQMVVDQRRQDESLILTGDLYAAVVEWNVVWRIAEPRDYVTRFDDVETLERTILAVARSTMHRAVGDYSAEEVLTGERAAVKTAAWQDMSDQLERLRSGVEIVDLQMQRVTPPTRVRPAFDDVNASIQQRDQLVNEAIRERNMLTPTAEAHKDQLIREAEGYAARLEAETQGKVAALRAKYEAYRHAPEVTRQRMYLEAMERVLSNSGPKTILDSDLQSLLPLLNLGPEPPLSPAVPVGDADARRSPTPANR
ncbi:FtsH protease activity modulator HflK [Candidatus Laterigemmans baculatus]|uniref:FtsH protease activity modulator HflK n=1 Tax=Candidatus Laterigemmans baculatus TaxID=2770505 RepID=UPI0013DD6364|nr:FtsH protease activity modulator HflK [Candidatus Laterigemmans baculatus]